MARTQQVQRERVAHAASLGDVGQQSSDAVDVLRRCVACTEHEVVRRGICTMDAKSEQGDCTVADGGNEFSDKVEEVWGGC